MPEQDPIPPRRSARRHAAGEDEEVPPWANLPPIRPVRSDRRNELPGQRPDQGPREDSTPPPRGRHGALERGMPPAPAAYGAPFAPSSGGPAAPSGLNPSSGFTPPGGYASPGGYAPPGGLTSPRYPTPPGGSADPFSPVGPGGPAGPTAPGGPSDPAGLYGDEDDETPFDPDGAASRRGRGVARASRALSRKRRRMVILGGSVVVAIAAVLSVVFVSHGNNQATVISDQLITTFQRGEFSQVPNACGVIPPATVQQYLPGTPKKTAPLPINGKLESACNWTLDHQPTYRLLEVDMLAYAPNGMVPGNGSATNAAVEAYDTTLQSYQKPPKHSLNAGATVTMLQGVGNAAFSASETFRVGGATSDEATVVILFHNVIVTVEFSGLEHSNKGHYGPVNKSELSTAALAFAQSAYASLH